MVGLWMSNALPAGVPDPATCGNFVFQVTNQTATSVVGTFTGKCGTLEVTGDGNGQVNGIAVTLNVNGKGTGLPGITTCTFSLTANGNVEDNGNALPLSYSGTTCLGPVHGHETLRRPTPPAPPPPPVEPPPPPPAPTPAPPSAPEGFDLQRVRIVGGSPDIRNWPITSEITMMEIGGGSFKIDHTRRCSWPGVDMGGAIQEATIWIFQKINGQWYGTGGERLRPCQTEKQLGRPSDIWTGWFYNDYWAPFTNHVAARGEVIGFMIAAGSTRADNNAPVHERTRVVLINWPGDGGGRYPGWLWTE